MTFAQILEHLSAALSQLVHIPATFKEEIRLEDRPGSVYAGHLGMSHRTECEVSGGLEA